MAKNKKTSYRKKKQSRETHYGALIVLFFVALFGTCGFFAWKQYGSREQKDDEPAVADSRNINTANVADNIGNSEEKETGNSVDAKEQALRAAEGKEVERNDAGLKVAEVYVANVGQDTTRNVIYASGVITNVVNNSGTCTYTFSNGYQTIEATGSVLPSAKETICGNVEVDASQFGAGQWSVKLNFKSDYAEGESDATTFTIQ